MVCRAKRGVPFLIEVEDLIAKSAFAVGFMTALSARDERFHIALSNDRPSWEVRSAQTMLCHQGSSFFADLGTIRSGFSNERRCLTVHSMGRLGAFGK